MKNVYLYGSLKSQFGEMFRFDVATAAEAIRALNCAFPQRFITALREGSYNIIRGRRRGGMHLDIDLLSSLKLGNADLHIVPVAKGSGKGGGAAKAIQGVAVPIIIGECIVGSQAISAGADIEDISVYYDPVTLESGINNRDIKVATT